MKRTVRNSFGKGGFTLIEVVAVLLILGIVAAVVAVRMSDTSAYDLASQVEVVKNHLRYAQIRAMNTDTVWGINFTGPTTYYLFKGADTKVLLPGEDSTIINLAAKKSGLTITSGAQTITFDAYGSPGSATITIATSGGTITVTQNTGFIP